MKQGPVKLLYNFDKRFMGWTLHMIMCVLLCYPVSIHTYYQQGVLFLNLVIYSMIVLNECNLNNNIVLNKHTEQGDICSIYLKVCSHSFQTYSRPVTD